MSVSSLWLGSRSVAFAPLDEGSGGASLAQSAEGVVNTTTAGDQTTPAVAVLANGGHVVLWQSNGQDGSGWGIYGRLTAADGSQGAEFRVNTYTGGDQSAVQVAALADGGFVATWQSRQQDGWGLGVFAQRYDAAGKAIGAEFQVNTTGYGHQQNSRVAGLPGGGFVVTWQGTNDPNGGDSIYQRYYDRDGRAAGGEIQVSPNGPATAIPVLAVLADGGWVIGWQSADGSGQGVFQQRYDAAGAAVGLVTQANSASVGYQTYPAMVGLADGGWVVAWSGADGSNTGVFGQRFNAAGQAIGERFRLNTYTVGDQSGVKLAVTADGGFIATWHSANQDGSGWGIYGQRFDALGGMRGGEFRINDTTAGDQIISTVAADADGGFVVAWQAAGQDGAGYAVVEKSYTPTAPVILTAGASLGQGGSILASTLLVVPAQGDPATALPSIYTRYAFEDMTAGGGHFEVNGVAQTGAFEVSVAELNTVRWVAGDTPGTDTYRVRAFDGVRWSDWAESHALTVAMSGPLLPSGEAVVNTATASDQMAPAVAVLANGGHVTLWQSNLQDGSGWGVYGRLTRPDGTVGPEFRVNTYTAGDQNAVQVAALADGGFVATWQSKQDGWGLGVVAQRYDAAGKAVGAEFQVNTTAYGHQQNSQVVGLADGGFVVTWQGTNDPNGGDSIYQRRYDREGRAVGGEVQVSPGGPAASLPVLAVLAGGGWVVSWQNADGSGQGIFQQRYNAAGAAVGVATQVNSLTTGDQTKPAMVGLADGGWVVAWREANAGPDVYGQRFNAAGQAVGDRFRLNTFTAGEQSGVKLTATADGGFVATWHSSGQDGSSWGVYGQRFDANCVARDGEFRINDTVTGEQSTPAVAAGSDGGFVVAWQSAGQDGAGYGVVEKSYGYNKPPVALDTAYGVGEDDLSTRFAFQAFDRDPGAVLSYTLLDQPGAGSVVNNGDGTFAFVAGPDFHHLKRGEVEVVSFHYRVTDQFGASSDATVRVSVLGANSAPVLAADVFAGVEDVALTLTASALLANDSDPEGDVLSVVGVGNAVGGSVTFDRDSGRIVFTPAPDRNGPASFQYTVDDGQGGVATQTVTVNLAPVNDAPLAVADRLATLEDKPLTIAPATLLANDRDIDGDSLRVVSVGDAIHGAVSLDANGNIIFVPAPGFSGSAQFTYTVADPRGLTSTGAVEVTVTGTTPSVSLVQSDESVVNTYKTGDQTAPAVAMLANGGHVTLWQSESQDGSGSGVYGRVTRPDGSRGAEFRVNSYTASAQMNVQVAALAGGGFVAIWQSYGQDGSVYGVYGQRFDATGVAAGAEFKLNEFTPGYQQNPQVIGLADGGFVATWVSVDNQGGDTICGRRYDSAGRAVGSQEFTVDYSSINHQTPRPGMAALADGGWVVTWECGEGANWQGIGIFQRRFDAAGQGGPWMGVNSTVADTDGDQKDSVAVGLADGGWVVAWTQTDGSGLGIYGRRFNAAGQTVGERFRLNTSTNGAQSSIKLAATADGGFIATWQGGPSANVMEVYGQRFDVNGVARGGEFRINDTVVSLQSNPAVAAGADGGFVVAWQSSSQDGSGYAVVEKTYAPGSAAPVIKATGALLGQNTSILASALLAQAHVQGDSVTPLGLQSYTRYAFEDVTAGGGHFEVDGVAQTGAFEVAAGQLITVRWVAGATPGSDIYRVRAFDGLRWSAWMEASAKTVLMDGALTPSGETMINTTIAGDQTAPAVAMLANGGHVTLWQANGQDGSGWGVYGRVTRPDGGKAAEFQVNSYTLGTQDSVQVAALAGGGFVATWQSSAQDGALYGVYGQCFDATGVAVGSEIKLNEITAGNQQNSRVVGLADGGFVVTWVGPGSYTGVSIWARRYDHNGHAVGSQEFEVHQNWEKPDAAPAVAALADGGWVIAWEATDYWGVDILQCRFDAAGHGGPITRANTLADGTQKGAAVVGLAAGGWVVAWTESDGSGLGAYGQRFNAAGQAVGERFRLNTFTTGDQTAVNLATTANGGFVATWQSIGQDGSGSGIYGQRFDANGVIWGSEFLVNSTVAGEQLNPAVAAGANGGFVVAWQSAGQDGSGYGVVEKTYTPTDGWIVEMKATGASLKQGASIPVSAMLTENYIQGSGAALSDQLYGCTHYAFEEMTAGGGHFEVNGVARTGAFEVTAAELKTMRWVAGSAPGSDTYRVRAFDGARWSAWAEARAETVAVSGSLAPSGEKVINTTTTGDQAFPVVAVLANGGHVTLWHSDDGSGWGVYGRVTAPDGAVGPEFRANTYTYQSQDSPQVTALADGGFVVTWVSGWAIGGQRFDAAGTPVGTEFRPDTRGQSYLWDDRVAALADGGFVVIWGGLDSSTSGGSWTGGVWGRRYNRDGSAVGSAEFMVNTTTAGEQANPSVTALADGGWVVTFDSPASGTTDVFQRRYTAAGVGGTVTRVNPTTAGWQTNGAVLGLADGGWVATWTDDDGSGTGIYGQRYNAAGQIVGASFRLNSSTAGDQYAVKLVATADGGFISTWQSNGQDGSGLGVYGQRFGANCVAQGGEFRINDTVAGEQSNPAVAARPDGGFVVAWQSAGQDGSGYAVVEKTYAAPGSSSRMLINPPGAETLTGGNGADTFTIGRGAGVEVIDNRGHGGDGDVVAFGAGIASDQLWFQRMGDDLKVSIIGTVDSVTISAWYTDPANRVSELATGDGSHVLAGQVDNLVSAMAAFNPPAAGQTQLTTQQHQALDPVIAANWHNH